MDFIVWALMILGLPLVVVIWLTRRALASQRDLERLHSEVVRLENRIRTLEQTPYSPSTGSVPMGDQTDATLTPPLTPPPLTPNVPLSEKSPFQIPKPEIPLSFKPRWEELESTTSKVHTTPPPIPPSIPPQSTSTRPPQPTPAGEKSSGGLEQFMGVKLFSWVGGFILFLGIAYFIKYSFENNLIPPALRIGLGYLTALGLIWGGLRCARKEIPVMAQSLCGSAMLILYGATYSAHKMYDLIPSLGAFTIMVLITAAAFLIAARLKGPSVAILGMLGGFVTPVLFGTGVDNPVGLFGYVALLDLGLLLLAISQGWTYLVSLSLIGTLLMQFGWNEKFYTTEKTHVALTILFFFHALYSMGYLMARGKKNVDNHFSACALIPAFVSLLFTFTLNLKAHPEVTHEPGMLFTFMFATSLLVAGLAWIESGFTTIQLALGGIFFISLGIWTVTSMKEETLYWGLGAFFAFAVIHSFLPVLLFRRHEKSIHPLINLFPALALGLVVLFTWHSSLVSLVIWPAILLIDFLGLALAVLSCCYLWLIPLFLLTLGNAVLWMLKPSYTAEFLNSSLTIIGGFAILFFLASMIIIRRFLASSESKSNDSNEMVRQIPAFVITLPFLLLILLNQRIPMSDPSPLFGMGLIFTILGLYLTRTFPIPIVCAVSGVCVLGLETVWHLSHFSPESPWLPIGWYVLFHATFLTFPFIFRDRIQGQLMPWAVSATAGIAQFHLYYKIVTYTWPNEMMGLLPLVMALPPLAGLFLVTKLITIDQPRRLGILAWFGGVTLFFVTLIFPLQFEKEWLTLSWAMEGVALLWLFHRIPHPGLRWMGILLLTVSFVRVVNPEVLMYHPRSGHRIFNWYFYTYGSVAASCYLAARLSRPPRDRIGEYSLVAAFISAGTIVLFILMNIEIADYFSNESFLVFKFSGNFARDMSYSIGWALFALVLLIIGLLKQVAPARYTSIVLLSITLFKLFFHDLSQLDQLYRIGSLIVVAMILMTASFLYQKFFAALGRKSATPTPPSEIPK